MKTLLLTMILLAGPALAHDEPTDTELVKQLDRIEAQQRQAENNARIRAFREAHQQRARAATRRGMCAVNGTC